MKLNKIKSKFIILSTLLLTLFMLKVTISKGQLQTYITDMNSD